MCLWLKLRLINAIHTGWSKCLIRLVRWSLRLPRTPPPILQTHIEKTRRQHVEKTLLYDSIVNTMARVSGGCGGWTPTGKQGTPTANAGQNSWEVGFRPPPPPSLRLKYVHTIKSEVQHRRQSWTSSRFTCIVHRQLERLHVIQLITEHVSGAENSPLIAPFPLRRPPAPLTLHLIFWPSLRFAHLT